jgi:hypothetical protein
MTWDPWDTRPKDIDDPRAARRVSRYHTREMAEKWPNFRVTIESAWLTRWEGPVEPLAQPYLVRIEFVPGVRTGNIHIPFRSPRVYVLDPAIRRRAEEPNTRVPHLYNEKHPARLCLFFPTGHEWGWRDSIAETILPWTCEWLARYEFWLATGKWTGPAEHPEPLEDNALR